MKVLLVGEYSGVHTNLAKGLKNKGHSVFVVSDGDGYKKIGNPDLFIVNKILNSDFRAVQFLLNIYYLLLNFIGLNGFLYALSVVGKINRLKDYDVVQLINTRPFSSISSFGNLFLLFFIFKNNKKVFLCALGDDYTWVKSCLDKKQPYSKFERLSKSNIKYFMWSFLYVYGLGFKLLNRFVLNNIIKVIPGVYDYYFAYSECNNKKLSGLIPLPIETNLSVTPYVFDGYPIKIFHGWQKGREFDKGNDLLDRAVLRLIENHPSKVEYEVVSSVPYEEYIRKFNDAVIYLDQCYSLDRGMNAILGMRAGKVVFSGFHRETADYFNANLNKCLIDAKPNIDEIYLELERLIFNPIEMEAISKEAIQFVKKNHDLDLVVDQYLKAWMD